MIPYLILALSFFFDGILTNYIPYMVNDLSYFTPLLTITSISLIYPFFHKKEKQYFITILIVGFLYDLFYTNLLFTNMIFFGIVGYTIKLIYTKLEINAFTNLFLLLFQLCFYIFLYDFSLFAFNIVPISISNVIYHMTHSIAINIIYGELVYLLCKHLPQKRRLN